MRIKLKQTYTRKGEFYQDSHMMWEKKNEHRPGAIKNIKSHAKIFLCLKKQKCHGILATNRNICICCILYASKFIIFENCPVLLLLFLKNCQNFHMHNISVNMYTHHEFNKYVHAKHTKLNKLSKLTIFF